jgi:bifunctional non-homologous end joining protein LigD
MPLSRRRDPFDHRDWLFELKLDGFRAIAYVDGRRTRLMSRKAIVYRRFDALSDAIAESLEGHAAVLDGELVCLDEKGRPQFYTLLYRRAAPCFFAFDLLWLDGEDVRPRPLLERKRRLAGLLRDADGGVCALDHVRGRGRDLFTEVCRLDLEGIVAKDARAPYAPEAPSTWVKVKNPRYSQAEARWEHFDRRRIMASNRRAPHGFPGRSF